MAADPKKFRIKRTDAQMQKQQEASPPVETPPLVLREETPTGGDEQGGSGERSEQRGQRGTCWSITINNPRPGEERCDMPGWRMTGQFEVGTTGTRHWQGCLNTPQVRWAAVKKMYPRAHISLARNEIALKNYVRKEDTRASAIVASGVVNIFQFQDIIAGDWKSDEFSSWRATFPRHQDGDVALMYVDSLVRKRIRDGQRGAEWIAMNPLWRSVWKNFYAEIIARHATPLRPSRSEAESELRSPGWSEVAPWTEVNEIVEDVREEGARSGSEEGGD